MNRRSFISAAAAGLALFSLPGCGSGDFSESGGVFPGTGSTGVVASQGVSGRIAPELVFTGAEVGSAYGPSTVTGNTFTTRISATTVGLLALGDSSGGVRGFTLTFPGESPVFSAENSALAIVFMEPGFLRLDPGEARSMIASIRASSLFTPFVQIVQSNAGSRRLDLLSGDGDYITAREALTRSLGNPFTAVSPTGRSDGKGTGTIFNPSPRFLRVVRDDQTLPQFLAPFGALPDQLGSSIYTFYGLGPASTLPNDTSLVEETYFPTLVFTLFLPWLALAAGQKIPVQLGLDLTQRLRAPSFAPRAALVSTTTLAVTLAVDGGMSVGDLADSIDDILNAVGHLITGGAYLAGLAFIIGAILKFKQHKDNPTQLPLGSPESMALLAAILLHLPTIEDKLGQRMFDNQSTPPPSVYT